MRLCPTALAAALALVVVPGAAATKAATYADTLTGVEVAATSTRGTFVGTGSGGLPGAWGATVDHTPLRPVGASITGGRFTVTTKLDGSRTLITGRFTGGTISVADPGRGCRQQRFRIAGVLGDVGLWSGGDGSGAFDGVLVHYRKRILGTCATYAASVSGTVALTFSRR